MNFSEWITMFLTNFGFAMFILAILIALIDWPIQYFRRKASGYDILFRWIALLALGFALFYAFILHAFFPVLAASAIGWPSSPFQFEVAVADLGLAFLGIFAFRASYGFRLATVIMATCFLWGAAVGHIYQMVLANNYTVGNAGSWFWMDIILPLVLIILIIKLKSRSV